MIKWRNRALLVSELIQVSFGNISILYQGGGTSAVAM